MRRRLGWLAVVGVAVALTVLATWLALDLLLGEADQASSAQRPAARIDAIRTGLTVAAGGAALFALALALRRQWYTEHDSRERRITELYVQSVEQLGSERAPVRLGGLYALARLGQDNPGHRQTVVDVWCAYLRMPFDGAPPDELQVRHTAQHLLSKHLAPFHGSGFWPRMLVNLSGATLDEFYFAGCKVQFATFTGARFTGTAAEFWGSDFITAVRFDDATSTEPLQNLPPGWRTVPGAKESEWRFVESDAVDGDGVAGVGQ